MLRKYIWNILVSIDQFINTLLGGDPDETISSRCAKNRNRWPWKPLAWFLEWLSPGHLERAEEDDEGKDAVWR